MSDRVYPPFATRRSWTRPNMRGNEEDPKPATVVEDVEEPVSVPVVSTPEPEPEPEAVFPSKEETPEPVDPSVKETETLPESKGVSEKTGRLLDDIIGKSVDLEEHDENHSVEPSSETETEDAEEQQSPARKWKPWNKNSRKDDLLAAAIDRGLSVTETNTRNEIIEALEASETDQ